MNDSAMREGWWMFPAVAGGLTAASIVASFMWFPDFRELTVLLGIAVIGVTFVWVYAIDPSARWWAILPGMGILTVLAAVFVEALVGVSPAFDWVPLLIVTGGSLLTAFAAHEDTATFVLLAFAALAFMVGVALAPIVIPAKAALWAAAPALVLHVLWRRQRSRLGVEPRTGPADRGSARTRNAAGTLG